MINSGWFAETFPLEQRVPKLAEYYQGGLRLAAEPGTIWTYTDHGFATLGQIVEDISRRPLDRYFRERIFEPLGMTDSDLLRAPRLAARLATGYRIRSDGAKAVIDRQGVTPAAGSIYSTPHDMGRYIAALLTGGAGEHGSILRPDTVALMFQPHYQPDPQYPVWASRSGE
jgi:CubicO group peptidase (beta-lactamase class C family)